MFSCLFFFIVKCKPMLGALIALLLLVGCNDTQNDNAELASSVQTFKLFEASAFKFANNPLPGERITFLKGFSFVAPQGENWIEGPRQPEPDPADYSMVQRIVFIKLISQDEERGPHAGVAIISTQRITREYQMADAKDFMRSRMNMLMAAERLVKNIKVLSQKSELDNRLGYECFRYDGIAENYGVIGFRGIPFKVDTHSYECLAPSKQFAVRMLYGQMTPPEVEPINITRDGEGFLKSLQFSTPQG